jgi:hypothetical protein
VFGDVLQMSVDAPFIDGARQLELEDKEYDSAVLWSTLTVVSTTCFECGVRVGEKAGSLGVRGSGLQLRSARSARWPASHHIGAAPASGKILIQEEVGDTGRQWRWKEASLVEKIPESVTKRR